MANKATTITVTRAVLNHLKRFCAVRGLKTGAVAEYAINYYIWCCEQQSPHSSTSTESANTIITGDVWIVPPQPPRKKCAK